MLYKKSTRLHCPTGGAGAVGCNVQRTRPTSSLMRQTSSSCVPGHAHTRITFLYPLPLLPSISLCSFSAWSSNFSILREKELCGGREGGTQGGRERQVLAPWGRREDRGECTRSLFSLPTPKSPELLHFPHSELHFTSLRERTFSFTSIPSHDFSFLPPFSLLGYTIFFPTPTNVAAFALDKMLRAKQWYGRETRDGERNRLNLSSRITN
uniref:Uncharacterized protein n=1 Tax=Cacopsylla melanoneura TaxID=428564 RepID=A0A8D9AIT9_9HEMI